MTVVEDFPFPKEKTIGILGGGQLGRMLASAAGRLGFHTIILDPAVHCPAAQFANRQIVAQYDDEKALIQLASACHVVTYEFENIPVSSAELIENSCRVYPDSHALGISQDRLVEKKFIHSISLKTTAYADVSSISQLMKAAQAIPLPAILKTRRLGYDGKGQIVVTKKDIKVASTELSAMLNTECILEEMVDFDCEISVIAARNSKGQTSCYDPANNTHIEGMLSSSTVPGGLASNIIEEAKTQAIHLLEELQYVGVIGVEFFVTKSGELLINEFAPRVHNSGHWTEAACLISQFEQHIRAITGLPLGSAIRHSNCVMHNLIGDEINNIARLAAEVDTCVNDYGKQESRPGRKMGHVTKIFPKN